MATKPRSTPKTSAELKKALEAAKKRTAMLEQKLYAEELTELISKTNILADYAKIQQQAKDIKDVAILQAIINKLGYKRIAVTEIPAAPRKPSSPRKKKTS